MLVARLEVHLTLYASDSLKDRRAVVTSVKERLRNRFNVAIAETGEKENWRHAEFGIVTVAEDRAKVDRTLEAVGRFLDGDARFEVVFRDVEYY
jgi:uncharacterized protein YlxP (DUF503 family)